MAAAAGWPGRIRPMRSGNATPPARKQLVQLVTLDPGHFHAALVQKFMLPGVSPEVRVYAPPGDDLDQHLKRIEELQLARRESDALGRAGVHGRRLRRQGARPRAYRASALAGTQSSRRESQVLVLSGNNARKSEYIGRGRSTRACNVLADKPMVIKPTQLAALEEEFRGREADAACCSTTS